jgi:hypothetical protein
MDDTYDISIVDKALNLGKKSTAKSSSQPNLEGLNPDFASRLQEAQSAYRERFKKELPITSGVRTTEQQAKLYANPNKKYPAAKEGTSPHEFGNAIDINPNVPDEFLNEFGLHRPHGKKDLVHVEAMPNYEKSMPGDYDISIVDAALNKNVKPKAKVDLSVPTPESMAAEQQRRQDVKAEQAQSQSQRGILEKYVAPVLEVPLAIATSIPGAISEQLTGKNIAYQPVSGTSQDILSDFQRAFQESKLEGMMGLPARPAVRAAKPVAGAVEGVVRQDMVRPTVNAVTNVTQNLKDQFVQKGGKVSPAEAARIKQDFINRGGVGPEAESQLAGVGAARAEFNPYGGLISGEEGARGAYPTVKLSKIRQDAPPKEQAVRGEILQDVLGNQTNGIRQGVLTGNEDMLRNEYTLAKKSDTPAAQIMKDQLAKEQVAISNYAQDRVNRTGANQNFANDYERGQAINNAFAGDEGVTGWFKQQKNDLYQTAKDTVGDNPITTNNVDNLLSNKQFRASLGLKGNENVAKSAENLINLAKTVGFEDEFGNFHPANSISAWDAVRKSLNQNWTKDNASVIRKINQAIDKDVATAGGGDLYKAADRMHQAEKTLFGSKGIKTLFGDVDPNGVQAGTAFDVIPQKLNSMPFDQWRHIYDTADQLSSGKFKVNGELVPIPEDIRIAAQAAKNEMKGSIARDIYSSGGNKVGEWNSNAANKRMNFLDQKIRHAFDPEEIQSFHKLNYAGQLMPTHGYEGAALQTSRVERLAERFPAAGSVVGGTVAGPKGAIAGQYLGEKSKGLFKGRSQRQAAERLQQQLEENFRKGRE